MVKDTHRDMIYTGTMRCSKCNEESHLPDKFPFFLEDMTNHLDAFMKLHDKKGCNKEVVEVPNWASSKINLSIANN